MINRLQKAVITGILGVSSVLGNNAYSEGTEDHCKLIETYIINPFFESLISGTAEERSLFKRHINKQEGEGYDGKDYDGKEREFIEKYKTSDMILLRAAYEDRESEEDMEGHLTKISRSRKKNDDNVKYFTPEVQKAIKEYSECQLEFFNALLNTPIPSEISEHEFKKMMQCAFTTESLDNHFKRVRRNYNSLNTSMLKTVRFYKRPMVGGIFNTMKEEASEAHNSLFDYLTTTVAKGNEETIAAD